MSSSYSPCHAGSLDAINISLMDVALFLLSLKLGSITCGIKSGVSVDELFYAYMDDTHCIVRIDKN